MSKKLSFLLIGLFVFILTGCGDDNTTSFKTKQYTGVNFQINYPSDWTLRTQGDFDINVPKETLVAFSQPQPRDGYQMTISIVTDIVPNQTTSLEYAQANINQAVKNVIEFEKIEEKDIMLNEEETKLIIFNGKSSLNAKMLRYLQVYAVQGNLGYTVTASALLDTQDEVLQELENLLTSFHFITTEQ